ncbi:uncharacterized protein [Cardiocondyla obscurior]|uniref:uncharacterized protein n=1 Tax=Cardiocondyla obscurior TaxID=286306 RepID=UPI00396579D2
MRVHLILVLFFVSTALARGVRNKREDVTTALPSTNSASEISDGYTSPNDTKNKCDTYGIFEPPIFRMILQLIKLIVFKMLNLPDNMKLPSILQPNNELAAEIYQHYLKSIVPKIFSILQSYFYHL